MANIEILSVVNYRDRKTQHIYVTFLTAFIFAVYNVTVNDMV